MTSKTLSGADREQLQRATVLRRPIVRAARLARRNGASLLVFGALGVLLGFQGFDAAALTLSVVLIWTGAVERRTAPRLERADPSAPWRLARNELVLMAAILVFAALQLTVLRPSGEELAAELADLDTLGMDVAGLADSMNALVYWTVIAVTLIYQGGLARYFLRRRAMVDAYLAESPAWARDLAAELGD